VAPARPRGAAAAATTSPERDARRSAVARRSRGGAIAWILVGAALLAGVVFVNLADLRLNLRLEQATSARAQLRAEDAALDSQLSGALASGRIQQLASVRDGLVQADPSTIGYINLGG
jgi:HAMP domain-containing protein